MLLKSRHGDGWPWLLTQDITKIMIHYFLLARFFLAEFMSWIDDIHARWNLPLQVLMRP